MSDLVLFCGAGGATEGLSRAGWDVGCAVDSWDVACEAHRRWRPEVPTLCAYVEEVALDRDFDRVWASPSCKPWSTANRTPKRGTAHPEYYSLARLVRQVFGEWHARWLIIENVGGLIWSKEGRVEVGEFEAEVAKWPGLVLSRPKGGCIASNTLGVPQLRRRVFFVIGPRYVSLRPGGVLLPKAGGEPLLWEGPLATTRAITADEHQPKRVVAGVVDASQPSRHANWTRALAGVVDERGRVNGAERLRTSRSVRARDDSGLFATERAQRSVEAGEHLGRLHEARRARARRQRRAAAGGRAHRAVRRGDGRVSRRCYGVRLAGVDVRVQTSGEPPSAKDLEALESIVREMLACDKCCGTGYADRQARTGHCDCPAGIRRAGG